VAKGSATSLTRCGLPRAVSTGGGLTLGRLPRSGTDRPDLTTSGLLGPCARAKMEQAPIGIGLDHCVTIVGKGIDAWRYATVRCDRSPATAADTYGAEHSRTGCKDPWSSACCHLAPALRTWSGGFGPVVDGVRRRDSRRHAIPSSAASHEEIVKLRHLIRLPSCILIELWSYFNSRRDAQGPDPRGVPLPKLLTVDSADCSRSREAREPPCEEEEAGAHWR
jgi:hypothetical protein